MTAFSSGADAVEEYNGRNVELRALSPPPPPRSLSLRLLLRARGGGRRSPLADSRDGGEGAEAGRRFIERPHDLLGVRPGASEGEIRRSYRRLAAQYHPDKFRRANAEERARAQARFRPIKAAFDILTDGKVRRQWEKERRRREREAGERRREAERAEAREKEWERGKREVLNRGRDPDFQRLVDRLQEKERRERMNDHRRAKEEEGQKQAEAEESIRKGRMERARQDFFDSQRLISLKEKADEARVIEQKIKDRKRAVRAEWTPNPRRKMMKKPVYTRKKLKRIADQFGSVRRVIMDERTPATACIIMRRASGFRRLLRASRMVGDPACPLRFSPATREARAHLEEAEKARLLRRKNALEARKEGGWMGEEDVVFNPGNDGVPKARGRSGTGLNVTSDSASGLTDSGESESETSDSCERERKRAPFGLEWTVFDDDIRNSRRGTGPQEIIDKNEIHQAVEKLQRDGAQVVGFSEEVRRSRPSIDATDKRFRQEDDRDLEKQMWQPENSESCSSCSIATNCDSEKADSSAASSLDLLNLPPDLRKKVRKRVRGAQRQKMNEDLRKTAEMIRMQAQSEIVSQGKPKGTASHSRTPLLERKVGSGAGTNSPGGLPEGWRSAVNKEGKTYYYHKRDRIPQWEPPMQTSLKTRPKPAATVRITDQMNAKEMQKTRKSGYDVAAWRPCDTLRERFGIRTPFKSIPNEWITHKEDAPEAEEKLEDIFHLGGATKATNTSGLKTLESGLGMSLQFSGLGNFSSSGGLFHLDSEGMLSPGMGTDSNRQPDNPRDEGLKDDGDAIENVLCNYDEIRKRAIEKSAFTQLSPNPTKSHDVDMFVRMGRGVEKFLRFEDEKKRRGIPARRYSDRISHGRVDDPEELEEYRRKIFGDDKTFSAQRLQRSDRPKNYEDRFFRQRPGLSESSSDEEVTNREVLRRTTKRK